MNLKLEVLFILLGAILRIVSTGTSIWYYLTQEFALDILHTLCWVFIIAPSSVFLTLTMFVVAYDFCNRDFIAIPFKLGMGIFIAIGGPVGAPLFLFAAVLSFNPSWTGDFYVIEGLSRSTTMVEALFESLPQITIQVYNNQLLRDWNIFKICSVSASSAAIFYSFYKLCKAIDKVKQYEDAVINSKIDQKVTPEIMDTGRKGDEEPIEVYDMSED